MTDRILIMSQAALVDFLASARKRAPHAAAVERVGGGALDRLAAPAGRRARDRQIHRRSVGEQASDPSTPLFAAPPPN